MKTLRKSTNPELATLRKSLRKIVTLTASVIEEAIYENDPSDYGRSDYARARGAQKLRRLKGKLTRSTNAAVQAAFVLRDPGLIELAANIADTTREILKHCAAFPRDKAWPGDEAMTQQRIGIASARAIIDALAEMNEGRPTP